MRTLEITIPVLNEEATLSKQIGTLHSFLDRHFSGQLQFKIVIADNGSSDGTQRIGELLAKDCPWLNYLRLNERGVGRALKASWGSSSADFVGYMDLDLATDLHHLLQALAALQEGGYDIVYATRLHPEASVTGRSMKRSIVSRIFNLILRDYLDTTFSDGMCGFKFLRRAILPTLLENGAASDGWFFSTELLAVSEWQNFKIYELPVHWTDDPSSKVRIFPLAMSYLKAMRILRKHRPAIVKP